MKERITFQEHLEAVKQDEPKIAVAPDINSDERIDDSFEQAELLNEYAETVVVVPKEINPNTIPSKYRIGVPCQKRFGPVPPRPVWEYLECDDLHLLGGSPLVHKEMMHKVGHDSVNSLDTASPIAASSRGQVWGRPFKHTEWYESPRRSYYERIESSLKHILKHHNENVNTKRLREIRELMDIPDEPPTDPLEYLRELPPGREELCLGPDEQVPFPGREYFYQDDTLSHNEWSEKYR